MTPIFELLKVQVARLLIDNRKELNKILKGLEKKGPLTKEDFSLLDMFFDVPIENLITSQKELDNLNSQQTREKTISTIEQIEREVRGVVDRTDYIHTALKELKERVSSSFSIDEESKPIDPLNHGEFNWTPNVELGLGGINRKVAILKRRRPDHVYIGPGNLYAIACDFMKKGHSQNDLIVKDLEKIVQNENRKSEQGCGQTIGHAVNLENLSHRVYEAMINETQKQTPNKENKEQSLGLKGAVDFFRSLTSPTQRSTDVPITISSNYVDVGSTFNYRDSFARHGFDVKSIDELIVKSVELNVLDKKSFDSVTHFLDVNHKFETVNFPNTSIPLNVKMYSPCGDFVNTVLTKSKQASQRLKGLSGGSEFNKIDLNLSIDKENMIVTIGETVIESDQFILKVGSINLSFVSDVGNYNSLLSGDIPKTGDESVKDHTRQGIPAKPANPNKYKE